MKSFIKIIYAYFFLFLPILINCQTDCDAITCGLTTGDTTCQPSEVSECTFLCRIKFDPSGSHSCHKCTSNSGYYTISEEGGCADGCTGSKIIYETSECTSEELSLDTFYKLGDVYFQNDPSNENIDCSSNSHICKCNKYFYIDNIDGKKVYNCFSENTINGISADYLFYNYMTGEFFKDSCPDGFKLTKGISINGKGITRCSDTCLPNEFHKYEEDSGNLIESCTDNCDKKTYTLNGVKRCANCEDVNLYEKNGNCITFDQCKFYSGNKCFDSCSEDSTNSLHNYGSKECINQCSDEYLYKYEDTNICYKRDQCPFIDEQNKKCLQTCDGYHNYDSNICLSTCSDNGNDKLYHLDGGSICYPSCISIPGGTFIYELSDNICKDINSIDDGSCPYYHIKNDGVRICYSQDDCISKGYTYFIGKECRENCEGYYKMFIDRADPNPDLIYCYKDLSEVLSSSNSEVKYYNINLKQCWNQYPEGFYIKNKDDEVNDKIEVVQECELFYYDKKDIDPSSNLLICIEKCKNTFTDADSNTLELYFVNGNKKCYKDCTELQKYYYNAENNECLDSCKSIDKFQNQKTNEAQSCIDNCEDNDGKNFYNYDSNICMTSCNEGDNNKLYHKADGKICYSSCLDVPGGTFVYESANYECLENIGATQFYYIKSNGVKKITTSNDCYGLNYIYLIGQECRSSCNDYYKFEDNSIIAGKIFIRCFQTLNDAETFLTSTNIYYNEKSKIIWKDISSGLPSYYYINKVENIDGGSYNKYELVEECNYYYFEYNSQKYCTDTCKVLNSYITITASSSPTPPTTLFFVNGNKKCVDSCTTLNKFFYDDSNNECLDTCKGRIGKEFADKPSTNQVKCRNKCDEEGEANYYYDVNTNLCIENCGENDSNKKYHKSGDNICYSSCSEIPGGLHIYEKDSICYDEYPSPSAGEEHQCPYFYKKADGSKQCSKLDECITGGYNYFVDEECRSECDGYYKLEDTQGTGESQIKFIKCFDTLEKAKTNCNFYNIKSKMCWNTVPDGYYINSPDGKEVVEECKYFYYKNSDNKYYCTNECKDISLDPIGLFFMRGQKNCENSCEIFNKYFYDPNNYECLDTCKGRTGLEFANKPTGASDKIQPCINSCQGTKSFHDYNSNICIDKCGSDGSHNLFYVDDNDDSNNKICYPSCKEIPGGNYEYESDVASTNTHTCSITAPTTGCSFYYFKKDGTKKCLPDENSCISMNYNYLMDKECRSECNDFYKLEDDTTATLKKCFKNFNDCLGTNEGEGHANYYNIKQKKCWLNFPTGYFINSADGKELVEECQYYYYENSGDHKFYCTDKCKTTSGSLNLYFISGQKNCESSCKIFDKYYYDDTNNECLDTCEGRLGKEFADYIDFNDNSKNPTACKSSCNFDDQNGPVQYYNFGTKICLSACDATKFTKSDDEHVCYDSCAQIEHGVYIYELGQKCYPKRENMINPDTDCPFYYPRNDGTMKCVTDCKNAEFDYVYKKECRKNCDDFYKLNDGNNVIKCYSTLQDVFNDATATEHIYYDKESKQCWKEYNNNYYIKNENVNHHEVVQKCDNYYYEVEDEDDPDIIKKYCSENCKDKGYFVQGKTNCESSCASTSDGFNKKYYDPTNNECLDTCKGRTNLEFANPIDSTNPTPQPCISQCEHYFEKKITNGIEHYECISACDNFNIKTKQCINTAEINNYYCIDHQCYSKCNINNYIYINTDTYECVSDCPSGLKKLKLLGTFDGKDIFLCQSSCNENQYRLGDKCLDDCPKEWNYIGNNKICQQSCASDPIGNHYFQFKQITEASNTYIIYKCASSCNELNIDPSDNTKIYRYYTQSEPNKCLLSCPSESKYYLQSKPYECLSECPDDFPFYSNDNSVNPDPNYIKCQSDTICTGADEGKFFLNGECKEKSYCITNNKKYIDSRGICLEKCKENEIKQKNLGDDGTHDGTYSCMPNCEYFTYYNNIEDEPECVRDCPKDKNFIGKNDLCQKSCDKEEMNYYFFKLIGSDIDTDPQAYNIYKCVSGCPTNEYKYRKVNNDLECYNNCPDGYEYLSAIENLCYDDCLKSEKNYFTLEKEIDGNTIKICTDKCDNDDTGSNKKYYGDNKICVESCNQFSDTKIIDIDNRCVSQCNFDSTYRFQLNGKCVDKCEETSTDPDALPKKRYSKGDYLCKEKCEGVENIVIDNICVSSCDGYLNPLLTGEYECLPSCPPGKFYYESENICKDSCNEGDKAVQNINKCVQDCNSLTDNKYYFYGSSGSDDTSYQYDICVLQCPENKPYINDENTCIDICPSGKKFFVKEFTHSETDTQKKCLNDCPNDYQFYEIIEDPIDSDKKYYGCIAICEGYYVPNEDTNMKAKLCLSTCPSGDYKYQIIEENNSIRKCYKDCPPEARYHFEGTTITDNNCYEECPEISPFHKKDQFVCFKEEELLEGVILYDIKEWTNSITNCPSSYRYYSKTEDANTKIICLNECLNKYGEYLTPYNTCVKNCQSTTSDLVAGKNLINDEINKRCICEHLFYIDDTTLEIKCFSNSIGKKCNQMGDSNNYKIPLHGTNQCLKTCNNDRILSPSEDICYKETSRCKEDIDSNSQPITKSNGQKKCECSFKFYISNNIKICLSEDSVCPASNNKFIPDTMECVSSCTTEYPYSFKSFCLKDCPSGSQIDEASKTCDCGQKFWYQVPEGNYECLDGNCLDPPFPLYSESTKQCLKTCKNSYYSIIFESKCYDSCDIPEIPNLQAVPIDSSLANRTCDCLSPWYYDANHLMKCPVIGTINKCSDYNSGLNYMIEETRECVNSCPPNYPYYFGKECFVNCDYANDKYKNIESIESSFECKCLNLWHKDPDNPEKIKCYNKNIKECTSFEKPNSYMIYETKECVDNIEDCPENSYKFNHICYTICPENTIEDKDNPLFCICDTKEKLWFEYNKYGDTYYECGLDSCPSIFRAGGQEFIRANLLENENKCVNNCETDSPDDNEYIYSFRNVCVKTCPDGTETKDNKCLFIDITDEEKINNLEDLRLAANIQAKELYEKKDSKSGYLMNKFDASLQIYSFNKLDSNKKFAMKSNLTYIDLGTCMNKIYEDKNLKDSDTILVTKYDLLTRNNKKDNNNEDGEDNNEGEGNAGDEANDNNEGNENPEDISINDKYLINQVEYEFYLSSTMEKIEASICSPYEILISYPISFTKNRFNNFEAGINKNNYLKQFMIGKELKKKNSEIDTFNKDNIVYKDVCTGVEIDGKDLVLEERYDYLYPNNVSLCESNCTMDSTDFDLERINCKCTYKEIIDFNRIDEETNDILNDPNFHKVSQSGANAQIIKCISQLKVEDAITNNEAFYYCVVISAVEVTTVFLTAFSGIKGLTTFIQGMANMAGAKPGLSTGNRILNNPPKKGENDEKNETNNKGNIIIKKNIKMNYNINSQNENLNSYENNSEISDNKDINYGINIKTGFTKKNNNNDNDNEDNKINNKYNSNNIYNNKKAEFIPQNYNFKFFNSNDKGVIKKISRSQIPFSISPDTKILLESKKDIIYNDNYLEGPFYEDQNIVEIIDHKDDNKEKKIIKFNDNNINDVINDINNENNIIISKRNLRNNKGENLKEEISKTKKRVLSNINSEEKEFITIKKINPINKAQLYAKITVEDYNQDEEIKKVDDTTSIYNLMKREHTYLRVTFEKYISKNHPNILATFLAEILDKIYFIKIFIFLKKFEIFPIHLSLYLLYHILLLSLLCGFFTINTIKKIWEDSNYPTINFYLLYGFLAHIIIWVIYKIFLLLLDNQDRIRALLRPNNQESDKNKNEEENEPNIMKEKYEELIKKIKIQTIVFYIIIFILTIFCFIYLVSFFAIYKGTKGKVLTAYYISIIEIILIKFVYALCLSSLRIGAEGNELKNLYKFVYICDKYLS